MKKHKPYSIINALCVLTSGNSKREKEHVVEKMFMFSGSLRNVNILSYQLWLVTCDKYTCVRPAVSSRLPWLKSHEKIHRGCASQR